MIEVEANTWNSIKYREALVLVTETFCVSKSIIR